MQDTTGVRQRTRARLRPPTLAELAVILRDVPDGPARDRLEDWYWAKAIDEHGVSAAHAHRWEYRWLRRRRQRLEQLLGSPALGAFLAAARRRAA